MKAAGVVIFLLGLGLTAVCVWLNLSPVIYWIDGACCGEGAILLTQWITRAIVERIEQ